jgi:PPM family protein phosphatase
LRLVVAKNAGGGVQVMPVQIEAATDLGLVRASNEDAHAAWVPEEGAELDAKGILLVVADGMGGALAGEEASRMATETMLREYRQAPGLDLLDDLAGALLRANSEIYARSQSDPQCYGMGTTCTAVVLKGRDLLIAHVGDSRAYLIDAGGILQLTEDHSLVDEMVRQGQLTPAEARIHPHRNIVTRAVGVAPHVEPFTIIKKNRFQGEVALLISSDGLHGVLDDATLLRTIRTSPRDQACATLIQLAKEGGGPDNITCILAWPE